MPWWQDHRHSFPQEDFAQDRPLFLSWSYRRSIPAWWQTYGSHDSWIPYEGPKNTGTKNLGYPAADSFTIEVKWTASHYLRQGKHQSDLWYAWQKAHQAIHWEPLLEEWQKLWVNTWSIPQQQYPQRWVQNCAYWVTLKWVHRHFFSCPNSIKKEGEHWTAEAVYAGLVWGKLSSSKQE